jgi:hypothetical protein
MGSYHSINSAPVIPRMINMMKVSMPKKPNGLTNRVGNVNFIPIKIVRSTPE